MKVTVDIPVEDFPYIQAGFVPHAEMEEKVNAINAALRAAASGNMALVVSMLADHGSPAVAQAAEDAVKGRADKIYMSTGSELVTLERRKMAEVSS